jgi:hypothetical protein
MHQNADVRHATPLSAVINSRRPMSLDYLLGPSRGFKPALNPQRWLIRPAK